MTRQELEHIVDECLYHLLPLKPHRHLVDTIMRAADAYAEAGDHIFGMTTTSPQTAELNRPGKAL